MNSYVLGGCDVTLHGTVHACAVGGPHPLAPSPTAWERGGSNPSRCGITPLPRAGEGPGVRASGGNESHCDEPCLRLGMHGAHHDAPLHVPYWAMRYRKTLRDTLPKAHYGIIWASYYPRRLLDTVITSALMFYDTRP